MVVVGGCLEEIQSTGGDDGESAGGPPDEYAAAILSLAEAEGLLLDTVGNFIEVAEQLHVGEGRYQPSAVYGAGLRDRIESKISEGSSLLDEADVAVEDDQWERRIQGMESVAAYQSSTLEFFGAINQMQAALSDVVESQPGAGDAHDAAQQAVQEFAEVSDAYNEASEYQSQAIEIFESVGDGVGAAVDVHEIEFQENPGQPGGALYLDDELIVGVGKLVKATASYWDGIISFSSGIDAYRDEEYTTAGEYFDDAHDGLTRSEEAVADVSPSDALSVGATTQLFERGGDELATVECEIGGLAEASRLYQNATEAHLDGVTDRAEEIVDQVGDALSSCGEGTERVSGGRVRQMNFLGGGEVGS